MSAAGEIDNSSSIDLQFPSSLRRGNWKGKYELILQVFFPLLLVELDQGSATYGLPPLNVRPASACDEFRCTQLTDILTPQICCLGFKGLYWGDACFLKLGSLLSWDNNSCS